MLTRLVVDMDAQRSNMELTGGASSVAIAFNEDVMGEAGIAAPA